MRVRPLVRCSVGPGILAVAMVAGGAGLLGAQETGAVRGQVVDAGTRTPVVGAEVSLEGADLAVLSGPDGGWELGPLPHGEHRVTIRQVGYGERTVVVRVPDPGGEGVRVALTPSALPLDAVVVTASRRSQRLADVPVTTELITRQDIDRTGVSELSALLVERTGIQLEGGHPAGEGVMLQGIGSERVLILMDGQPFVGRISGQIDLSRIPTSMIERIEVVKGPQSSLYGSEAMGGVINVITRTVGSPGWEGGVDMTLGTQGRADAAGRVRGGSESFSVLVDAGRRTNELTPGRADETGALSERWDGLLKLAWAADTTLRVEANALFLDERQRWQGGQVFHFADNRQWSAGARAEWRAGGHQLAPALYATEFDHLSRRALEGEPVAGTGEREVQRLIEAELLYHASPGGRPVELGVEAQREETVSDRVQGHRRRLHSVEPFAQLTWSLGPASLVPGVRLSWSEQWGSHWTPRLAAMYRPIPSLALRGTLGRGYRAPGFKELYMEFLNLGAGTGYAVRGNAELRPETSTNVSAGAEWSAPQLYVRGQAYYNRFVDFIETSLAGDSSGIALYSYGNIGRGTTRGIDLEAGFARGALRAEAGYGYLDTEDRETGLPLLGRPTHSGRMLVEYTMPGGVRGSVVGTYTGSAPIQRTEEGVLERGSLLSFDLRAAKSLPRDLELVVGARNLLNERPESWPGHTNRHVYLRVGWRTAGGPRTSLPSRRERR